MNRAESTVIGFVVGILCPASLFVLLWWSAAALAIYHVLPIPDSGIAVVAFTGLGVGIVLDVLCLKNWIAGFYHASVKLMALAYLFWSAIAVAFFMGLPCGNVVLGTLAGLYVGRKQHHVGASREMFARAARNVSLFTALVTSVEALPIGLLGLHEEIIVEALRAVAGLDQSVVTGPLGVGLVGIGCVVLMIVQFWCTRTATALAFRPDKNVA
jgi:hypothetical protein